MNHYHIECNHGYNDCFKCKFLIDCFPKTYNRMKIKPQTVEEKWKEKYGDEF